MQEITIFSKDYCPYCDMAKELLKSIWIKYIEIDVTNDQEKVLEISQISWFRTVPQIFVWEIKKENCLWWYSDIKKLNDEWKLLNTLQKTI